MFHVKHSPKSNKKPKIFSVVNQKGGVGKTTTAVNLATTFAAIGKKVLVIDFDPQGNASTGLGLYHQDRSKTVYDVLINDLPIQEAIFETEIPHLALIPSTVDLAACEVELANIPNREYVLKEKLQNANLDFDCIFIDCPPSLGLLTVNALACIDSVLIPMQCEFFALEGLSHLINSLELVKENLNPALKISGIILTMYDKRNKLTEQVEADVRGYLKEMVYKSVIPRNIKLSEAPSYGMPAIIYDSNCSGSLAYMKLAKEVIKKEKLNKTQ